MDVDTSWWSPLADVVGHSFGALACLFVNCRNTKHIMLVNQLRYADKYIVNIMKEYIERNNLQLESIRYSNKS